MKKLTLGVVVGLLLGFAAARWLFHPSGSAEQSESATESKGEAKPAGNPLQFTAAKRATAGITVAAPRAIDLPPEIEAFGRVLDPTPYVTLVAEEATAQASLAASEKELERVRKLFAAGGNASAQAVEAAEAVASRDRAAVASAHIRLLAGWGATLADHADLATLRDTLAQGAAIIRIDLLPGSWPSESKSGDTGASKVGEGAQLAPKNAQVTLLGGNDTYDVEVLGPAPVADPQVQGRSFLALLKGHSLPAGATLRATIRTSGATTPALTLAPSSIVYHQGSAWVYVLEKDVFERRLVTLGQTVGADVVISHGIEAGDRVATTGVQQLLSAELVTGSTPDER